MFKLSGQERIALFMFNLLDRSFYKDIILVNLNWFTF
jgi:hypothetical protein